MTSEKLKYVRYGDYNEFIIFSCLTNHDEFKSLKPISAGFCYIMKDRVECFDRSVSLNLKSLPEDDKLATRQIFGIDAMLKLTLK